MKSSATPPARTQLGFSLVEMLVVIAVIGILAAIAVPNVGNINDAANDSKNRRNAQNLASVCSAAQSAGRDFVTGNDVNATIDAIVTGATISDTSSPFYGTYFGVPNLSPEEREKAAKYLGIDNGMIGYYEDGAPVGDEVAEETPAGTPELEPTPEPEPEPIAQEPTPEPEPEPAPQEPTWSAWKDFQYISNSQVGGRIAQLRSQMPEKEWQWIPTSNGSFSMIQFRELQ